MYERLNNHLAETTDLPQDVIEEVCWMFRQEAGNLLNVLSDLKPGIRDIVIRSVRSYHEALDANNTTFVNVARIMADTSDTSHLMGAANDRQYALPENVIDLTSHRSNGWPEQLKKAA
jgi:hypothetical protein